MGSLDLEASLDMMPHRSTTLFTYGHERLHLGRIGLDLKPQVGVCSG